jgi:putative DNA methylase
VTENRYPKRLIEVDLPIARISAHARREKSIRHGHISTLHIWWARRPLAACRAVICASLWPDPVDPLCPPVFRAAAEMALNAFAVRVFPPRLTEEGRQLQETLSPESRARWEELAKNENERLPSKETAQQRVDSNSFVLKDVMLREGLLDFIADFANWDNSTVSAYLETSRALTQSAHEALGGSPGTRPLVVDPFAGGGSIPLEALRVGADAFASDLNPIPVLLNKVALEYIPKYGQRLADEVQKWGEWIYKEADRNLKRFYPLDTDGGRPIAYLWARTILSESPGQDIPVEIPLIHSFWLGQKPKRRRALRWCRDKNNNVLYDDIVVKYDDGAAVRVHRPKLEVFEPSSVNQVEAGTTARGSATCPITGFTTAVDRIRNQLLNRKGGCCDARLLCVVVTSENQKGRTYRKPTQNDLDAFQAASAELNKMKLKSTTKLSLIPEESMLEDRLFNNSAPLYGMMRWGDLFSSRQQLALVTFCKLVREVASKMQMLNYDDDGLPEAVQTVLAMNVGKLADYGSTLATWSSPASQETIRNTFGRQALPMVWDFAESYPLASSSGGWSHSLSYTISMLSHNANINKHQGHSSRCSATSHILPNDIANAIVTDPPYYYSVQYAGLSDYFYVWLKRSLNESSEFISQELTPKTDELVVSSPTQANAKSGKNTNYFEQGMTKALTEARRVCEHSGILVVVFAQMQTSAWEAFLHSVVEAGWIITASWSLDTERTGRIIATRQTTLASSIHLVCRPRENADGSVTEAIGEWRDVLGELPQRIHEWMPRLTAEGVVGADAIFACLGPALEIFSRYSRVEKSNGETATLREYLEHIWAAVSTEALSLIFKDANAAGLEPDARLTAMWLWTIGGGGTNGKAKQDTDSDDDSESAEDDGEESTSKAGKGKTAGGFLLEYDAARKIAQGLGANLEQCQSLVEVKGDKARLLPVAERTQYLFGKGEHAANAGSGRKKKATQKSLFGELDDAEAAESGWSALKGPTLGATVLDRVHQSMILFAANRGELLKRFLIEDGVGKDPRFWKLADNLNKLYPPGTDERRWVEGVLARKKGLGQ